MNTLQKSQTIMIVDDTPENLKLLGNMLEKEGYRVSVFLRGDQALAAAQKTVPDLILLDIMMPEIDGYETCHRMKADPRLKEVPIIFLSALGEAEDKVKAFESGGVDYITKPFQLTEVRARIQTQLRLRQLQTAMRRTWRDYAVQTHLKVGQMEQEIKSREEQLQALTDMSEDDFSLAQSALMTAIAKLIESRKVGMEHNIDRIQACSHQLVLQMRAMGMGNGEITDLFINNLFWAAAMHNIGKCGVPDGLLLKPAKLTSAEISSLRQHVAVGVKCLEDALEIAPHSLILKTILQVVSCHHERWDGSGYPSGLHETTIPLAARIVAVAETYDALMSPRAYRPAYTPEDARQIIHEAAGKQFDPDVVKAFMEINHLSCKL
jgi:putative two-component system response regulator